MDIIKPAPRAMLKYTLDCPVIKMPKAADIKHVGFQNGLPTAWAEVPITYRDDPDSVNEVRQFQVITTGMTILEGATWLLTFFEDEMVFHLYEVQREDK